VVFAGNIAREQAGLPKGGQTTVRIGTRGAPAEARIEKTPEWKKDGRKLILACRGGKLEAD
jgi:hypothetical protein